MNACPKCTSHNLFSAFIPQGRLIDHSGRHRLETEFITSNEYDFFWQHVSAKDHLKKCCGRCQYQWRENTADGVNDAC